MKTISPFARIVLGALSACIVMFGIIAMVVKPMMPGRPTWDGTMLGPFAIVVGSLFLVVLVLVPRSSRKSERRH